MIFLLFKNKCQVRFQVKLKYCAFIEILSRIIYNIQDKRIAVMWQISISYRLDERYRKAHITLRRKNILFVSIVGDSISTYEGYNPDRYKVFYNRTMQMANGLNSVYDTWWAKVNQSLHAYLCVNNSYSGSKVTTQRVKGIIQKRFVLFY